MALSGFSTTWTPQRSMETTNKNTAMSRITYHLRRQRNETWREYFAKWDGAIRKAHQHKITLPEEYEGFLMINGLQLTETETKAMLNYTHGCIKPSSIKSWLRKNETRLSAAELGADKKKTQVNFLTEFEGHHIENNDIEENDEDKEEIDEIEQCIMHLQDDVDGDTVLSEGEAAEILSTYVQQKKTYTQSIKNKKARELVRGYGKRDRPLRPGSYSVTIAELQKRTRCAATAARSGTGSETARIRPRRTRTSRPTKVTTWRTPMRPSSLDILPRTRRTSSMT